MANIKHLEKDYNEILLGLSFEEIAEYYKQLNRKLINTYPSMDSILWNAEEQKSILNTINDVTSVLKTKYPKINLTNISSRYMELLDKYLTELDVAYYKLSYEKLFNIGINIQSIIKNIHFFLITTYNNYVYEKEAKQLGIKPEVDIISKSSVNDFLKMQVKEIEANINLFEDYFSEINISSVYYAIDVPEEVKTVISKYNELYSNCSSLVEEYKELKVNPFKQAIIFDVEVAIKTSSYYTEEDYSRLLEEKTASAPKYNFETFELIVPITEEGVVN